MLNYNSYLDRMIVVVNKYLLSKGFLGISLWPFIIVRHQNLKKDQVFLNHERIHLRQQAEMLVLPFYLWYTLEFFLKLLIYKNALVAYRNISFEREAYMNEKDPDYCRRRKFWNFTRYLRRGK
ncbi:hypothetical protein [Antarcticibacterium sp. 1MA-6-2]|uniref:hypothetical protein n=1 Tax=Antarcticibacterium sp. 1MA-6-2 TaxID=2908210 RepID=UPI00288330A8|nr:hypothetical protein [Antarcticibacterium sp. 1MA-6-2]